MVLQLLAILNEQLIFYSDYAMVVVGHSLGGSIASLGAIALQMNFPETGIRCYTYGAPRSGVSLCLFCPMSSLFDGLKHVRTKRSQNFSMKSSEKGLFVVRTKGE